MKRRHRVIVAALILAVLLLIGTVVVSLVRTADLAHRVDAQQAQLQVALGRTQGTASSAQGASEDNAAQLAQAQGALGLLRDQVVALQAEIVADETRIAVLEARAPVPGPMGPAGPAGSRGAQGPPGVPGPPGQSSCNGRKCG